MKDLYQNFFRYLGVKFWFSAGFPKLTYKIAPLAGFYYYLVLVFTPSAQKIAPQVGDIAYFGKPWSSVWDKLKSLKSYNFKTCYRFFFANHYEVILKFRLCKVFVWAVLLLSSLDCVAVVITGLCWVLCYLSFIKVVLFYFHYIYTFYFTTFFTGFQILTLLICL